jgi:hypothetical protein
MSEVDFSSPIFLDHPIGWQSPADLVAGFTLAWALELRERLRLSPHNPSAPGVMERLPARYRYDTLGRLIELEPGASGRRFGSHPVVRLTTLCGAWQLFDLMNESWQLRPQDYNQFADVLSYVTGGVERPSLYGSESADISKCLLAVRVRRASTATDELDLAEQWFVTGDEDLTFRDARGNDSLQFHFTGMNIVPLALFSHQFVAAIWSTARVTVDRLGPDRVIARHSDRTEFLTDLLERGGEKARQAEQTLNPMQFRFFDNWPGWV